MAIRSFEGRTAFITGGSQSNSVSAVEIDVTKRETYAEAALLNLCSDFQF